MNLFKKAASAVHVGFSLLDLSRNLKKSYGGTSSWESVLSKHFVPQDIESTALDIGCGANPANPFNASVFHGVDIRSDLANNVRQADLSIDAIPFEDNYFNYCTSFNVFEHIPRSAYVNGKTIFPFIQLMNEVFRILKPGGLLLHVTPAFPSKEAFMDPTHVNLITEDTFPCYFCEPFNWANKLGYGFNGCFKLLDQKWLGKAYIVGLLESVEL